MRGARAGGAVNAQPRGLRTSRGCKRDVVQLVWLHPVSLAAVGKGPSHQLAAQVLSMDLDCGYRARLQSAKRLSQGEAALTKIFHPNVELPSILDNARQGGYNVGPHGNPQFTGAF